MGHSDAILKMLHNYIVFCNSWKGNLFIDEDFYITDAEYQRDNGI